METLAPYLAKYQNIASIAFQIRYQQAILTFRGIPEYDIPPLDPIDVIPTNITNNFLKFVFNENKAYGLTHFKVKKFQ